ncbi:hypothetical protein GUJ93_ZPchr0001g30098 [Zizania palustris]|uniref:Uncharacterized protein n=1 Tax=Zizania palustris TaxID=103762 RepID=A0A8J5R750_ZIZPA|nr:hypothetical protein GUJ93_ZPchr0001g30098 [Zizania palustris]
MTTLRVVSTDSEAVAPELTSTSLDSEGLKSCERDFRGLFLTSEYAELSPIEESEGTFPDLSSFSCFHANLLLDLFLDAIGAKRARP